MTRTRTVSSHPSQSRLQQPNLNSGRMKRPLAPIDSNYDPLRSKRPRIAVEILARPKTLPKTIAVQPTQIPTRVQQQQQQKPTVAKPENPLVSPRSPPSPPPPPRPPQNFQQKQAEKTPNTATNSQSTLTKHQSKLKNGIKHELDRLQPSAADTSSATAQSGRKLRSQEATRFKSELSAYFPDYDEVIGNDPKEQHILNLDTPIIVIDTDTSFPQDDRPPPPPPPPDTELSCHAQRPHSSLKTSAQGPISIPVRHYGHNLFTELSDSQRIDFTFLEARYNGNNVEDPLPDSSFQPAHKKAERLEKSIRNTEKGRAQHEKDQVIRLLNELQGHDWLRTMGVNGVTESRKKTFEPARDHFIRGCQAILEKFRLWSQEEKKRKLEKERAMAEEAEQQQGEDENEEEEEANEDGDGSEKEQDETKGGGREADEGVDMCKQEEEEISDSASDGDPPDYSDVDASIAKQLNEEASARASYTASDVKRCRGGLPTWSPERYVAKEFTSFFAKRHQRDAALNNRRRRGRTAMAWGHPVPDTPDADFELPEEYRDAETLKAHARQKRRARREGRHG
ncbi:hypothetical protein DL762_004083 [Monosporascus cannonballus]|uniref:Something about silencing protein 4 domain-containing protein n=1 Tax=Monosporascus cannonballus TaxID=155416 RepID=A0ABY0HDC9_9PEZI|nr:hypothetical protein DL762_004083 [Monosporascus cannonballus]